MNNIIKTFGCRLNIFETEVIKNFITKNKMKNVSVLNTCAVTKEAEKKSQREIKKIKNKNKNSFLIVTGCASQLKPETFEQMNEVDLVLGNQEKLISKNWSKINSLLENKKNKYNSKLVSNIMEEKILFHLINYPHQNQILVLLLVYKMVVIIGVLFVLFRMLEEILDLFQK